MKKSLLPILLLSLTSCAPFQYQSEIQVGGSTWKLPKDLKADYVRVTMPMLNTNGQVMVAEFVATNITAKMNPDVLDKATQHDVAIINASGTQVGNILGQAIQAAAKGAKP